MPQTPVESSLIQSVEYFGGEHHNILEIMFHDNPTIYCYIDIPPELYNDFITSESLGSFYNHHIKGFYHSAKRMP